MPPKGSRVTVSTVAIALNQSVNYGHNLTILNGANAIDLGDSTVTAGTGASLAANQQITVPIAPGDVLYGIRSGASDSVVSVLRT